MSLENTLVVPDHIKALMAGPVNNDALTAGASVGFPVLTFRGKVWAVSRGGERNIIRKNGDPTSSVNLIIVESSELVSKTYYAKGYESGASEAPDCYSNDGIVPAADAPAKQADNCAVCPMNVWGSDPRQGGSGKGKACADVRRIAVVRAKTMDDPMLLRIPPTGLKALAEYARELTRLNVPFWSVTTKVSFDPEAEYPLLRFEFGGFLEPDQLRAVQQLRTGDPVVTNILGRNEQLALPAPSKAAAAALPAPTPSPAPVAEAPKPKPKAAKAPPPAAADEEDEAPAPKAAAPARSPVLDDPAETVVPTNVAPLAGLPPELQKQLDGLIESGAFDDEEESAPPAAAGADDEDED